MNSQPRDLRHEQYKAAPHLTNAAELEKRFTYHPPKDDQPARYEAIRAAGLYLAELIDELCPESREKSLAFTSIEQAVMWANAAIARRE